jgi:diguanylate cyclase (GGDEF)-like protein/PAS domain S-box-containing protein
MPEPHRRQSALAWSLVAFVAGVALSAAVGLSQFRVLRDERDMQLDRAAERSYDALHNQLAVCGLLVRSVQSLFLASEDLTATEFERVYGNLRPKEVFPSLQAMAYAHRSVVDGREHYVTSLVAPREGNERLLGLDLERQPSNLDALKRAERTDQPAMTAAFLLVQLADLPGNRDGIVIRLPVYSPGAPPRNEAERAARIRGSLAVSFRISTLIATALPAETLEVMDVRVRDLGEPGQPVLYASGVPAAPELSLLRVRDLHYGGRTWRMELRPRTGFALVPWQRPAGVFAGGVLASLLLAGLVWALMRTRGHALLLAEQMSAQYRESEARFRSLNELLPALVLLARADGRIVYANRAARDRLGLAADAEISQSLEAVLGEPGLLAQAALDLVAEATPMVHSVELSGPDGSRFWTTLSLSRIELQSQAHILAVASDITELRALTEQLRHQATHDSLTGLANRYAFEQRLDEVLARPGAHEDCALLYLDLDQFKLINDTSGHYAGDQLLSHLAQHLRQSLEPGEMLGRLGGDEFGVLLDGGGETRARRVAERLRLAIDGFVFVWENRTYSITASIGVALVGRSGLSKRELLAMADTACYLAKERGRNRSHVFVDTDDDATLRRSEMEWVNRVRWAMAEGRLGLDFQELRSLRVGAREEEGAHFELLLRLQDEDGRAVPPGAFIPAAERYGLMPQLDRWVVSTALANFDRLHPSGKVALCAINLSGPTVDDDEFAEFVLDALREHRVPAHKVCFEITETAAVGNMARVVRFITRLREVGCRFALDDFGAGMSSFGYLKNLPVDMIKIDGSFIRELESDPMSFSIVRAVTQIGHQIGLKVIAEWVGSDATCELLRLLGVNFAQGYFLHAPEPTVFSREAKADALREAEARGS